MKLTGKPNRRDVMSGDAPPAVYSRPVRRRDYVSAKPVGGFVPKLTRKAFQKHGFSSVALISDWSTIVGPVLAAYTLPERLKWPRGVEVYSETDADQRGRPGATLVLGVDASRALEVEYSGPQIIERVNGYFGYAAVARLKIMQRISLETRHDRAESSTSPTPEQRTHPDPGGFATAAAELGAIENQDLRDALARLALNLRAEAARG